MGSCYPMRRVSNGGSRLFFGPATPLASSGALVNVSHEAGRILSLPLGRFLGGFNLDFDDLVIVETHVSSSSVLRVIFSKTLPR